MNISIESNLKEKCNVSLGCIIYKTNIVKTNRELWEYIENTTEDEIKKEFTLDSLTKQVNIHASREAYKKLGKEPSRYRVSSEALIRRILQGKGLYKINNVVDTNNLISIETGYSVGSYDLKNVQGDILFRTGKTGEKYQGIGKENINIENLPVFSDNIGAFGSPTSDSTRTMITEKTKDVLTVLISFNGKEDLEENIETAKKYLIKYANVKEIECKII